MFPRYPHLSKRLIVLDNYSELKKVFNWKKNPILDDPDIFKYASIEDLNQRRILDAQTLGLVSRNINPTVCLDIGTGHGHSAALIAVNAPKSKVYTVNIDPQEAKQGKGGKLITQAYSISDIGKYYKGRKIKNIKQLIANTNSWNFYLPNLDLAFIDGCHDRKVVYTDSIHGLKLVKPGGFLLWHDFNPEVSRIFAWVDQVCLAVDDLYRRKKLASYVFMLRHSWTGLVQV